MGCSSSTPADHEIKRSAAPQAAARAWSRHASSSHIDFVMAPRAMAPAACDEDEATAGDSIPASPRDINIRPAAAAKLSPPSRPPAVPPLQSTPRSASAYDPTPSSDRPTMDGAPDAVAWLYAKGKDAFDRRAFGDALERFEFCVLKLREAHVRRGGLAESFDASRTEYRHLDDYLDLCRTREVAEGGGGGGAEAPSLRPSPSDCALPRTPPPASNARTTLIMVCSPRAAPLPHLADEAVDVRRASLDAIPLLPLLLPLQSMYRHTHCTHSPYPRTVPTHCALPSSSLLRSPMSSPHTYVAAARPLTCAPSSSATRTHTFSSVATVTLSWAPVAPAARAPHARLASRAQTVGWRRSHRRRSPTFSARTRRAAAAASQPSCSTAARRPTWARECVPRA